MATTTIVVTGLNVPPLTYNTIWFANAASWNSYFLQAGFSITMTVADANNYGLVKAATTVAYVSPPAPVELNYNVQTTDNNGNPQIISVPAQSFIDMLQAKILTLETDYIALKQALLAAGLITAA